MNRTGKGQLYPSFNQWADLMLEGDIEIVANSLTELRAVLLILLHTSYRSRDLGIGYGLVILRHEFLQTGLTRIHTSLQGLVQRRSSSFQCLDASL